MKLPIISKDKVETPQKSFGIAFIDKEDKKLKIKKHDSIIEFSNDQDGGNSCKFYECTSVGDTTWSGYEWILVTKEVETEPVVNSYILTATSDWGGNGEYVKSTEMNDGCPVYVNGDYKLFRVEVATTTHYWCVYTTLVTSPGSADASEAHNEDTPPASLGGGWCIVTPVTSEHEPIITKVYEKSNDINPGLSWTSVKPQIGKSYSADALVEISYLYQKEESNSGDNPEVQEPEEPTPEEPEAAFGTYLQISGSAAVNDGLDGIYKLNEAASTDIYKEWININDDTKKVRGWFEDIDPATYWTVYGGSDNYSHDNWGESSMSYPWNTDNSSFVWYYHAEPVADFHVTPIEYSDEPEVAPTKEILVAAGFDETGYVSGINGEYELLDVSATGTAREWHCATNGMRIVWDGFVWGIAPKDNMMFAVSASATTDPWDTTWYFMPVGAISGATVTKKSDIR